MRIYYLAGVILSVTTILSACGDSTPTECTISTAREIKQGVTKSAKFKAGTDCEEMRKLAEEGKPLPTIADVTTSNVPVAAATPKVQTFNAPFVAGQQKPQDLIATTDKQARVQELEKKIGVDSKQSRDPFTSSVINPVPKLETLLSKPPEPPKLRAAVVVKTSNSAKIFTPPDTKAAEGTKVTGTIEISGTIFAIVSASGESTSRYVKAGQLISNGKVLVKRIDTNAEPPIVVLQQNGVEVLRPVGAAVAGATDPNASQTGTANAQPQNPPAPPLVLPAPEQR